MAQYLVFAGVGGGGLCYGGGGALCYEGLIAHCLIASATMARGSGRNERLSGPEMPRKCVIKPS